MNRNVTPSRCNSRMRPKSRLISSPSSCAVGSSRMMKRAPYDSARAISTSCRCLDRQIAGARVLVARRSSSRSSSARASRRIVRQSITPPLPRLPVDEQVLGDRQLADDRGVLIDARDALAPRVAIGDRRRGLAVEAHVAGVGRRRPVSIETSVDLPAPLRPTSACDSPGSTREARRRSAPPSSRSAWSRRAPHHWEGRCDWSASHLIVLPQSDLSSTFAFVTSGAGNWSSRMPGARCTIVLP